MSRRSAAPAIRLKGVRHNNLKNFDLEIPLGKFTVITGLSGSGKSSLAFDTLFAEGQRRYVETFSPYARQFFDRMDKPRVDSIEGIPPAIAIEQRNSVKTTRSTVGTMTEVCDHARLLWFHLAKLHCPSCGKQVRKESPRDVWDAVRRDFPKDVQALITFELPLSEKLSFDESLELIGKQGYRRLLAPVAASAREGEANGYVLNDRSGTLYGDGQVAAAASVVRLEEAREAWSGSKPTTLTVVQDRVKLGDANRSRFVEACEQAYHFGKGRLTVRVDGGGTAIPFSNKFHCADCDREFREPTPSLFSYNNPVGACAPCKGFGRIISIDYGLVMPDHDRTLAECVVKPWESGHGAESQKDMMKVCRKRGYATDVPFRKLPKKMRDWVMKGDPDYGIDAEHRSPRLWYGVHGYFRWLESKSYKMHMRVFLSRWRSYTRCPTCEGKRFKAEALQFYLSGPGGKGSAAERLTLAEFYQLPIRDAFALVDALRGKASLKPSDPLAVVLGETHSRLRYLVEVGLGYLTLDRPTRSLSGGETERVNLTSCLGARLVNTLFVLDEPSVGLHPRDTSRLVEILQRLRDAGNAVVVVEHEAAVIKGADRIVDLGPLQGERGGHIVFNGSYPQLLKSKESLTGQYLSGRKEIPIPERRPVKPGGRALSLANASLHNLADVSIDIPLNRFVCVSGVSGSGKTTLIREVLLPALREKMGTEEVEGAVTAFDNDDQPNAVKRATLKGFKHLGRAVLVDQSSLGKTPRSNPAVYIGAFDFIREVFAKSPLAMQRGMAAGAFSFNSAQGQCERCRGMGFEKIEMQFLSDVFIRCPSCDGRRYRAHVLEVHVDGSVGPDAADKRSWSVADVLESTIDDVVEFLRGFKDSRPAARAIVSLGYLQQVGLGYLRLGQPINTLSGGECQRLKLVRHLAEFAKAQARKAKPTLFLFDEPTTGLHFDDVRVLLVVFQQLVDAGHSLVVIEHNVDVLKSADWLIDLGPDAGDEGGEVVVVGTPEQVAKCKASHTGAALRDGAI
ncbi:MAG: excinuclease ABC subunit A [Candidatus Binatia bacterium]|jgi:excinuclease ABC subunit A